MISRVWIGVVLVLAVCVCYNASPLDPVKNVRVFDLNSWIKHYDIAHYDPNALQHQHRRRRSIEYDGDIRIAIKGHDRIFRLKLFPDSNAFADNLVIESTNGPVNFNPDITYSGTLEDDETASVHGIITKNGLFEGTITTNTEEFHIEPLSRYLINNTLNDQPHYHSVIYKTSDVQHPAESIPCASHLLHQKHKQKIIEDDSTSIKSRQKRWLLQADAKLPYNDDNFWKQFKQASPALLPPHDLDNSYNQPIDEELQVKSSRIVADLMFRNVNKRAIDPKKTTCMLYLQADHQFFARYRSEEACIEVMTRHVQRVNAIYRNTDFNHDGKPDNITFMIKRIKVHTTDALKDLHYRFPGNYGVEKYLELFSEEDYDAFCLAYMFTYRDFEMGTLGLAWTGDLKNAGGVCEKNGHYRGSMKSLNTGIVTLLNYGKHVPPAVSHVTLAHEIGHNFGSPHDPEQCTPGGEDGNFIMFARATSGDKKNNNRFSPCSLKSINPVLNFKARSAKGCFTEPQVSLCGNGVVEDGEECDCGWEEDCNDKCCFPQRKHPPPDERPCHLTPRSVCSPSQGPCCSSECELKFGDKCRDDNGCRDASFCNGRGPHCPPSVNKPNKTICNKEFVCFMGECTGSICLAYGLESCQCIPKKGDSKTKACELCCKLPGDNQPCLSSFEWNEIPYDVPDMFSKPGTPCNDYSGYCDVFQVCREVDPSGPLATLRKLLLSDESIASFRRWLMEYWYTVALIISGVVILLVLCNKFLGKQHSQKLKTVTIVHGTTTEAVRLPPDCENGQVTVHPAIRSKVPLKRKVRHGRSKKRKEAQTNQKIPNGSKPISKKKKKVKAEEQQHKKSSDVNAKKVARAAKQNNKNKKVINYTSPLETDGKKELLAGEVVHGVTTPETDPFGKVQNWLLKSQNCLPKSKSTPEGLKEKDGQKSPQKRAVIKLRNNINKSHSAGNLASDKMRLQIVYKPPFKFSVKLRKPDKSCTAQDRGVLGKKIERKTPRTAVLIKTVSENKTKTTKPVVAKPPPPPPAAAAVVNDDIPDNSIDAIDANTHTVQSDLEVLLSDNEFSCTNK